jgi:UDP-N-acetylglucosamine:LPS N-acetylglucosamine transferase
VADNVVVAMTDPARLARMAVAARGSGVRDAGTVLAREILEVVRDRQR